MKDTIVEKIIHVNDQSLEDIFSIPGRIYTFLNPVSYLDAVRQKSLFAQFDGIFSDGSLLVKAIRLLYGKKVIRRSFDMTSMAPSLFEFAEKQHKTIYFIGSKEKEVTKSVRNFEEKYPQLTIVGFRNGYFNSEDERSQAIDEIIRLHPDFVIVGMGAVAQENFLVQLHEQGYTGIGFTCGGFIHQSVQQVVVYYPSWVDRWNLRFVYRFYKEKHTRKRYLAAAFKFPIRFLMERF